jgi:hypothetical protein
MGIYLKFNMVERKEDMKGCKSPTHIEGCPCTMCQKPVESCKKCNFLSDQDIVPRSIGKAIGMTKKQLREPENHRKESKVCHHFNDIRIPTVLYQMKKEIKEGMKFSATAVLSMRNTGVFKGPPIKK